MEYFWFIALGFGVVFLMSRGRGSMGCCGVGRGERHSGTSEHHPSGGRESRDSEKDVIDLGEGDYTIITPKHGTLPSTERAEEEEVSP